MRRILIDVTWYSVCIGIGTHLMPFLLYRRRVDGAVVVCSVAVGIWYLVTISTFQMEDGDNDDDPDDEDVWYGPTPDGGVFLYSSSFSFLNPQPFALHRMVFFAPYTSMD